MYANRRNIFASLKKSGSRNTTVTSYFRPEVEIRPFRACAMHTAIIIETVCSLWTWLWGRYHVPQNVFLVEYKFNMKYVNILYFENSIFGVIMLLLLLLLLSTNFIATQVLKQNFRAAMCHVLHYSCNVNAAVADSLHCRMICGTVPFSVQA